MVFLLLPWSPVRSWSFRFFRLGATIAVILVLWQIGFNGIRVGGASNPGATMSVSVPASDGVTTPLPQFQDRDLDDSSQVHDTRQSRTPPVSAPSPSPASVANPYVSVSPPLQASFACPSRFCSFSRFGSATRRPSSQARTLPLRTRSPPPGSRSHSLGSVFAPPRPALLSCPLLPRSLSPLSRVGHLRFHAPPHRCSPRGDIPMDWLRGQGFSTCEVCQRVLSFRFNGRCPSCFRNFSSRQEGVSDTTRPWLRGLPVSGRFSPVTGGFVHRSPRALRMPGPDVSSLPWLMWSFIGMSSRGPTF